MALAHLYLFFCLCRLTVLPGGTLRIMDVAQRHEGKYVCTSVNSLSSDSIEYNLHVLGKFETFILILFLFMTVKILL